MNSDDEIKLDFSDLWTTGEDDENLSIISGDDTVPSITVGDSLYVSSTNEPFTFDWLDELDKKHETEIEKRLTEIEKRLNILQPNKALEDEWDELKELGEKYRKLEEELLEKQELWKLLKK